MYIIICRISSKTYISGYKFNKSINHLNNIIYSFIWSQMFINIYWCILFVKKLLIVCFYVNSRQILLNHFNYINLLLIVFFPSYSHTARTKWSFISKNTLEYTFFLPAFLSSFSSLSSVYKVIRTNIITKALTYKSINRSITQQSEFSLIPSTFNLIIPLIHLSPLKILTYSIQLRII